MDCATPPLPSVLPVVTAAGVPRVATVPALFALYPKSAPEKVPRKLFTAGVLLTSWLRSATSSRWYLRRTRLTWGRFSHSSMKRNKIKIYAHTHIYTRGRGRCCIEPESASEKT